MTDNKQVVVRILVVMILVVMVLIGPGSSPLHASGAVKRGDNKTNQNKTSQQHAQGGTFANEFMTTWQRSRAYSMKFAEMMPEKHYGFKPTPEIMSFGEQVAHLGASIFWFTARIRDEANPEKGFKAKGKTRAQLVEYLKKAFAYGEKALGQLSDRDAAQKIPLFGGLSLTKSRAFLTLWNHISHHRGQMVIYLRLKGLTPPDYVGW